MLVIVATSTSTSTSRPRDGRTVSLYDGGMKASALAESVTEGGNLLAVFLCTGALAALQRLEAQLQG